MGKIITKLILSEGKIEIVIATWILCNVGVVIVG
jgi:hypothetical protein